MLCVGLYATVSITAHPDWLSTVCNQWCIEAMQWNKGLSRFMSMRSLPLKTPLRTIGKLLTESHSSLKRLFTNLLCLTATVADVLCLALKHFRLFFSLKNWLTLRLLNHTRKWITHKCRSPCLPYPKAHFDSLICQKKEMFLTQQPWFLTKQIHSSSRVLKMPFLQFSAFPTVLKNVYNVIWQSFDLFDLNIPQQSNDLNTERQLFAVVLHLYSLESPLISCFLYILFDLTHEHKRLHSHKHTFSLFSVCHLGGDSK